jgi:PAS domain S-box-containing protein
MVNNKQSQTNKKSLIESFPYLQQVLDHMDQVIWVINPNTEKILFVSPSFESVWGRTCESLIANPLLLIESVHPEDRLQVMLARQKNQHQPYNQAYRIQRPDGSLRWILTRTIWIHDADSKSDRLFCISQDISEQKQVEQTLRITLDRSRELVNLSRKSSLARKPEAVLNTIMSAYKLRSAQRAALLFFTDPKIGPAGGVELTATWLSKKDPLIWESESILYEEPAFWEVLKPNRTVIIKGIQSDPRLIPLVRDYLLEGHIQNMIIFPLIAMGEWRGSLLVYNSQNHYFDQSDLRHLNVLIDKVSIALYNLKLLAVEEAFRHEAEKANKIKTKFLATISHELRTPLTSIIGFTSTLLAEDVRWEPDEQRDFIQTIQREANRLQELIDHLLDLSRLEAEMLPISKKSNLINEIMEDALPQLSNLTSEHTLSLHIPDNLPPVYVDAKRIAQVLVNLVRNATTYSPKGTEISISASVRGSFSQIDVSDHGPGIPPAEQKGVFEAFRRGYDVEKGSTQGAGLGLAICKGLVEAHGGRIWIKKKNTQGTTISFTIPLVPTLQKEIPAKEES